MKFPLFVFASLILISTSCSKKKYSDHPLSSDRLDYLEEVKKDLTLQWPNNKTINLVFHGHSVPAGYFKTPDVNTLNSYPYLLLKDLKKKYPYAVINIINTSIGGETSVKGVKRFKNTVLNHNPDVLFLDYALNDRREGLEKSFSAWEEMIQEAKRKDIKIILLTPSPDLKVDINIPENDLENHSKQISFLAQKYNVGIADSYQKFKEIQIECNCLEEYMSQHNHPNEKGHAIIAEEILKFF